MLIRLSTIIANYILINDDVIKFDKCECKTNANNVKNMLYDKNYVKNMINVLMKTFSKLYIKKLKNVIILKKFRLYFHSFLKKSYLNVTKTLFKSRIFYFYNVIVTLMMLLLSHASMHAYRIC